MVVILTTTEDPSQPFKIHGIFRIKRSFFLFQTWPGGPGLCCVITHWLDSLKSAFSPKIGPVLDWK